MEDLDIVAPMLIAIFSSVSVFLFEQPLAVFMTAGGGALWAVWRHGEMKYWQAILWVLAATVTACIMVGFVVWLLAFLGATNAPARSMAGLLSFVIVDKPWRDKVLDFLGVKLEGVGK